jgi:maleylpyruvate isomerase
MADSCLVAQVANNARFNVDMTPYPVISRINAACMELPAFIRASPANQPDAER